MVVRLELLPKGFATFIGPQDAQQGGGGFIFIQVEVGHELGVVCLTDFEVQRLLCWVCCTLGFALRGFLRGLALGGRGRFGFG